jgi:hypothetical protein
MALSRNFSRIPFLIDHDRDGLPIEPQLWLLEGTFVAGRQPDFSGRPDDWDDGDPTEVEIIGARDPQTHDLVELKELLGRLSVPEREASVLDGMLDHVTQAMEFATDLDEYIE